jgi:hypothetical protein
MTHRPAPLDIGSQVVALRSLAALIADDPEVDPAFRQFAQDVDVLLAGMDYTTPESIVGDPTLVAAFTSGGLSGPLTDDETAKVALPAWMN